MEAQRTFRYQSTHSRHAHRPPRCSLIVRDPIHSSSSSGRAAPCTHGVAASCKHPRRWRRGQGLKRALCEAPHFLMAQFPAPSWLPLPASLVRQRKGQTSLHSCVLAGLPTELWPDLIVGLPETYIPRTYMAFVHPRVSTGPALALSKRRSGKSTNGRLVPQRGERHHSWEDSLVFAPGPVGNRCAHLGDGRTVVLCCVGKPERASYAVSCFAGCFGSGKMYVCTHLTPKRRCRAAPLQLTDASPPSPFIHGCRSSKQALGHVASWP